VASTVSKDKQPPSGIEARRKAALADGNVAYTSRRKEIVQAAAHVFRDRGPEATLRDVAEALGTDRASLYYYIGSKEELLQEIVSGALASDVAAAEAVQASGASTPDKIRALICSMVTSYATNYPHMSVYIEDLGRIARQDSEWSVGVREQSRAYEGIVISILKEGQRDGSLRADLPVRDCAMALFGMINWMHRWWRPGYESTPDQIAHTFSDVFLGGFANGVGT
jgi:AcrR family transcriptional regulator